MAGIELVASHRTTLTSGAMVVLALVPIAAIASVAGDTGPLVRAAQRWSFDGVSVVVFSTALFAVNRLLWRRPRMWL